MRKTQELSVDWKTILKDTPKLDGESQAQWLRRIAGDDYKKYRTSFFRHKSKFTGHKALEEEAEKIGIPVESIGHYWHKGKHFSIFSKNNVKTYFEIRDEIVESMKDHAPSYTVPISSQNTNPHLLVIDPADIHIGKLAREIESGDEYNSQIAVKRILEGVSGLLNKATGFNIDSILLIIGNDILHTDTPGRTTTSGTRQDTDGMWYDNFLIAKDVYIKVIESLMYICPVHVQYDPSNHDYTNGFFLADSISSWFSKVDQVTFNITPAHRKYFKYGTSLIGTTHGDGAKEVDLPILMASEASDWWHECKHRYWYTHHLHHKRSREIVGVTIETLRSASGTDSWHHRNGYQHNTKAVEGFIHHPNHGQIARLTHIF